MTKKQQETEQWGLRLAMVLIVIGLIIAVFSGEYSLIQDDTPEPLPTPSVIVKLTP